MNIFKRNSPIGWVVLVVIAVAINLFVNILFNDETAVREIELDIQNIDQLGQFIMMDVSLIENVSEDDSLIVKIGETQFRACYYKAYRPETEIQRKEAEFLNQPLLDQVCLYLSSEVADSLGLQNFEEIKGFISSQEVTLIVTKND